MVRRLLRERAGIASALRQVGCCAHLAGRALCLRCRRRVAAHLAELALCLRCRRQVAAHLAGAGGSALSRQGDWRLCLRCGGRRRGFAYTSRGQVKVAPVQRQLSGVICAASGVRNWCTSRSGQKCAFPAGGLEIVLALLRQQEGVGALLRGGCGWIYAAATGGGLRTPRGGGLAGAFRLRGFVVGVP